MKFHYVLFTAIFFALLLLPASWNLAHSFVAGEPFQPLDVFRDVARPVSREGLLRAQADSLDILFHQVVGDAETGNSAFSESVDSLDELAANLSRSVTDVNAYLPGDSSSLDAERIASFRRGLSDFGSNDGDRDSLEQRMVEIRNAYSSFSWKRVVRAWWKDGFLNGKYLRAYEDRLDKENAFVKLTRPAYQAFAWHVLSNPGEKAVPADSNFLFYRQDVEFLVRPAPWRTDSLENPMSAVLDFKKQLADRGVELLVVVVPGKPSVYPEFLNPVMYGTSGTKFSLGCAFVSMLADSGVNVVNLYPAMARAKDRDDDNDFLYLNTDTHWTPRGVEVAAGEVADRVRKYPFAKSLPKANLADSSVAVERIGDVATMANVVFPTQVVEAHVVKDLQTGKLLRNDFRKAKILILGDSFSRIYETDAPMSAGWISHLAKNLQTPVASIVSDGGASTLVREKLARKAGVLNGKSLVIWEFVERDLRFGDSGWKKVRLD